MLYLHVHLDDEKTREVKVDQKSVSIGRNPGCDVVLADISVSREHAHVEPHGNHYIIRDNHSTNGTFVNDRNVDVEILHPGDSIRIGRFILKVETPRHKRGDTSKIRIRPLPLKYLKSIEKAPREMSRPGGAEGDAALPREGSGRLIRLYEIQQELGFVDSLPSLLDRSLRTCLAELDTDRGCILFIDFQKRDSVESPDDLVPASIAFRNGSGAVESDEEIVVPTELVESIIEHGDAVLLNGSPGESGSPTALAAPFLSQGRLLGLVYLERRKRERRFRAEDLQFITLLSSSIAIYLTNTLLFDEIFAEKEKLQAVISGLTEGVLLTDENLRVIEASATAARLLEQKENLIGKIFFELTRDFKTSLDGNILRSEIKRGGCLFQMEKQGRGETGKTLNCRVLPFSGSVSGIRGQIVFIGDATELRELEAKKTAFIRNIAHKLRTPLTIIEGNLPLLRGGLEEGTPELEILEDIEKGSRRLCGLVDDFVSFMEVESHPNPSPAGTEEVALHELAWEAIKENREKAAGKNILFTNRLSGDLPAIRVDSGRMTRVLTGVLDNAVKFSPEGGVVSLEGERSGDVVRLHIIDEGPGIPAADQDAVFKLLHQVDEKGDGEVPGLGLGLAIARQIVRENGGDIQITSPYRFTDHGCCVTIVVPIASSGSRQELQETARIQSPLV